MRTCRAWLLLGVAAAAPGCTRQFVNPFADSETEPLVLEVAAPVAAPRESLTLRASGGDGSCYQISCDACPSGATVDHADCADTATYVGGPIGNVSDVVAARDDAGNEVRAVVTLSEGLSIFPDQVLVAPRATQDFFVFGGKPLIVDGLPSYDVCLDDGGGCAETLGDGTRVYRTTVEQAKLVSVDVGPRGDRVVRLRVTDSFGSVVEATLEVGLELSVGPPDLVVAPGTAVQLGGSGGAPPYRFALAPLALQSGGRIDASTGSYVAGGRLAATDVVEISDGVGATAQTVIHVAGVEALPRSSTGLALIALQPTDLFPRLSLLAGTTVTTISGASIDDPVPPAYEINHSDSFLFRFGSNKELLADPPAVVPTHFASASMLALSRPEIVSAGGIFDTQLSVINYVAGSNTYEARHVAAVPGTTAALVTADLDAADGPEIYHYTRNPAVVRVFTADVSALTEIADSFIGGDPVAMFPTTFGGVPGLLVASNVEVRGLRFDGAGLTEAFDEVLDGSIVGLAVDDTTWFVAVATAEGARLLRATPALNPVFEPFAEAPALTSLQVGDVDGDGVTDLLALHRGAARLLELRGGANTGGVRSIGIDPGATTLAVADFNFDGFDDVVVDSSFGRVLYFTGTTHGLGARRLEDVPYSYDSGEVARLVAAPRQDRVDAVLLAGGGMPAVFMALDHPHGAIGVLDANVVGALDVAGSEGTVVALRADARTVVRWDLGTGASPRWSQRELVLGLGGDFCTGLTLVQRVAGGPLLVCSAAAGNLRLFDDAGAQVTTVTPVGTLRLARSQLHPGDADGDGDQDLVIADPGGVVEVLRQDTTWQLSDPTEVGGVFLAAVVGDFDAASGLDVAVLRNEALGAPVDVLFADGDGGFAAPAPIGSTYGVAGTACDVDDVAGDELVIFLPDAANPNRTQARALAWDPPFGWVAGWAETVYAAVEWAACADLDGDGRADLIVSDPRTGLLHVLWREGAMDFVDGTDD